MNFIVKLMCAPSSGTIRPFKSLSWKSNVDKASFEQLILSESHESLSMMLYPQPAFTHIFLITLLSPLTPKTSKFPRSADVRYKSW